MSRVISQPWLGLLATVISVGGSMLLVSQVSVETLATWLTLGITSVVPLQLVLAIDLHHQQPAWLARLSQPWRGLGFTALLMAYGLLVSLLVLYLLGGGMTPPTPFASTFIIYAVMIAIWVLVGFQGWPASLIRSPLWRAIATLLMINMVTWLLFRSVFNFEHLRHAAFYRAMLDPQGWFVAWIPVTFTMTSVAALLTLTYFDFMPINAVVKRLPWLSQQPGYGMLVLLCCACVGGVVWWFGTRSMQMDLIVFLARVDVTYVFGALMIINVFQMAPFLHLPQPLRGAVLLAANLLLAIAVYPLYAWVAAGAFGGLTQGAPSYDLELWLASALLAVTFPIMTLYAGTFQFWPFAATDSATLRK